MKKLRTDFTFGFEFEGFARLDSYIDYDELNCSPDDDFDELPCNSLDGDDYDYFYKKINNFINGKLKATNGRTHYDGSVKNYLNGYQSFEYSSTVYKFNPKNFSKLNKFFSKLNDYQMGINETCGFHTHISYPEITEKDALWIISQIAFNDDWVKEVTSFNDGDYNTAFYNERYAGKDYLIQLKQAILEKDFSFICHNIFCNEKYRVLRLHPMGTLEWRGPRNFLNRDNGFLKYTQKLTKVIDVIRNALDKKELNGMSKEVFFAGIEFHLRQTICHHSLYLKRDHKTLQRIDRVGCLECFENTRVKRKSLTSTFSNVVNALRFNPKIFFNKDLEDVANYMISNCDKNDLVKIVDYAKKHNEVTLCNSARNIAISNPALFLDVEPYLEDNLDLSTVCYIVDSFNFLTRNDSDNEHSDKLIRTLFKHINHCHYSDLAQSVMRRFSRSYDVIKNMINEGVFKNCNLDNILSYFPQEETNKWIEEGLIDSYTRYIVKSINDVTSSLISNFNNNVITINQNLYVTDEDMRVEESRDVSIGSLR